VGECGRVILKMTRFPHIYNADGKRRDPVCGGWLNIEADTPKGIPYVICSACGEGYRFSYVVGGKPLIGGTK
jgi:hypothetical protein